MYIYIYIHICIAHWTFNKINIPICNISSAVPLSRRGMGVSW